MRIEREPFYFEPRCVSSNGSICWYGFVYIHGKLFRYTEETVYIRDDGEYIYVYELDPIPLEMTERGMQAECRMKLITEIKKRDNRKYGRDRS